MVELDRFVLRQACRQMAGWVADAGPLLLHVNMSVHNLLRKLHSLGELDDGEQWMVVGAEDVGSEVGGVLVHPPHHG